MADPSRPATIEGVQTGIPYAPQKAPPPEVITTHARRVRCDGGTGALGHPVVWLVVGEEGFVECGYCDRRFVYQASADGEDH